MRAAEIAGHKTGAVVGGAAGGVRWRRAELTCRYSHPRDARGVGDHPGWPDDAVLRDLPDLLPHSLRSALIAEAGRLSCCVFVMSASSRWARFGVPPRQCRRSAKLLDSYGVVEVIGVAVASADQAA